MIENWLAQFVGDNMEGLLLFITVYLGFPLVAGVIFINTWDFSLAILSIAVMSFLAGSIGLVLALAEISLFPIWQEDCIHLLIISAGALAAYLIWRRFFSDF